MQTLSTPRQRRLNIRLSQQEWDKVHQLSSHTTCRSISEYARKLLLDKPVRVLIRNQSFDDFEQRMLTLLPQLDAFRNDCERQFAKLSAPDTNPDARQIAHSLLTAHGNYTRLTEEIKEAVAKIADQCAQK